MIPPRLQAFGFDAVCAGSFLFEQIEGDVPEDGKIVRSVTGTDAGEIFAEGDVENPMEAIFNLPVSAHSREEELSVRRQGGEKIAGIGRAVAVNVTSGGNFDDRGEARPAGKEFGIQGGTGWGGETATGFKPTVVIIDGLEKRKGWGWAGSESGLVKKGDDRLMSRGLVGFEGQDIVGLLLLNLAGNFGLAAHGIDGYDAALEHQDGEQFRDGGDFVGMVLGFDLTQDQAVGGGPGADHVNGGVGLAARPTQGFSVNADDFTLSEIRHRSNPGQKPRLKLFWIEPHQHPSKGIVGRDSVG